MREGGPTSYEARTSGSFQPPRHNLVIGHFDNVRPFSRITALRFNHSVTIDRGLRWFSRCGQFTRIGHIPGEGEVTFAGRWPD